MAGYYSIELWDGCACTTDNVRDAEDPPELIELQCLHYNVDAANPS